MGREDRRGSRGRSDAAGSALLTELQDVGVEGGALAVGVLDAVHEHLLFGRQSLPCFLQTTQLGLLGKWGRGVLASLGSSGRGRGSKDGIAGGQGCGPWRCGKASAQQQCSNQSRSDD